MNLNLSTNLIQNLIIFLGLGSICLIYNKVIANEVSKLFTVPIRLMFGEKEWFEKIRKIIIFGLRMALYGGVLVSLVVLLLTLGSILRINA
ncbi:MAG TPA: hypothetical protein VGC58_00915 [Candidatus Paceibacterota bacterium]